MEIFAITVPVYSELPLINCVPFRTGLFGKKVVTPDLTLHLHLEASQFHIKGFVREYLYKCHYSGFDSETRMVTGLQAKSEILNFAGD